MLNFSHIFFVNNNPLFLLFFLKINSCDYRQYCCVFTSLNDFFPNKNYRWTEGCKLLIREGAILVAIGGGAAALLPPPLGTSAEFPKT